jgi:hypothetical protein
MVISNNCTIKYIDENYLGEIMQNRLFNDMERRRRDEEKRLEKLRKEERRNKGYNFETETSDSSYQKRGKNGHHGQRK